MWMKHLRFNQNKENDEVLQGWSEEKERKGAAKSSRLGPAETCLQFFMFWPVEAVIGRVTKSDSDFI